MRPTWVSVGRVVSRVVAAVLAASMRGPGASVWFIDPEASSTIMTGTGAAAGATAGATAAGTVAAGAAAMRAASGPAAAAPGATSTSIGAARRIRIAPRMPRRVDRARRGAGTHRDTGVL